MRNFSKKTMILVIIFTMIFVGAVAATADISDAFMPEPAGGTNSHRVLISGSGLEYIEVLDYDGSVVWKANKSEMGWDEVNDADFLPNGDIVLAIRAASGSRVSMITPDYSAKTGYKVLWEYKVPAGGENHTCQYLSDGGVLLAEAYQNYVRIVELDSDGSIRKTLGSQTDPLENFGPAANSHSQIRQAHKTQEGTYLLAHMSKPITVEFSSSGKVLKSYPSGGFTAIKDNSQNVIVSGGESGTIMCYNSTDGTKEWEIGKTDITGVSLGFTAGINVLKSGNIVFANWGGHGGASGDAVMEVAPTTKNIVWSLNCGGNTSNVQVLDDIVANLQSTEPEVEEGEAFRSPHDADSSAVTGMVYVADKTNKTIEVIKDSTGKIAKEIKLEQQPTSVFVSKDGSKVFVAMGEEKGYIQQIDPSTNELLEKVEVGHTPSAIELSEDGSKVFVANRFGGTIQTIALTSEGKIEAGTVASEPIHVTREPIALAVKNDKLYVGGHLPTGNMLEEKISSEVVVLEGSSLKEKSRIKFVNGSTNLKDMALSPDGAYLYITHEIGRYNVATTHADRGWVYNNALTEIDTSNDSVKATMLLDDVDNGAANPWGIDVNNSKIFISIAGTRELMVIDRNALRRKVDASDSETLPRQLSFLTSIRDRIQLGEDGPHGVTVIGNKAYVANYYSGSISIYDSLKKNLKNIKLTSQVEDTPQREGEKLWNDATIGFQNWQSCASCHPDARVDSLNWDNLNDGIGTPKQARTMLDSWTRGRVMSTGIRPGAKQAVRAGLKFIMFNANFPESDFEKIDAYVASLEPEVSPYLNDGVLTESAARGKELFEGEAGCVKCHAGETMGQDVLVYENFTKDPIETRGMLIPPLREVWRTAPYLHDGSATTIKDVITTRNLTGTHGNVKDLTDEQIDDISNYVLSVGTKFEYVDKTALIAAINEGDTKVEDDYTAESWAPFAEALDKAKEVRDNEAATQEEVDAAEAALKAAMNALTEKSVVNKDALKKAIEEGETKVETDYTTESWTPFAEALAKAKEVMDNDAATQEEVDAAEKALREAIDALEENPAVNKDALKQAIEEGETKTEENYTAESWAPFAEALAKAKEVMDNEAATQEEVDAAEKTLREAMDALENNPTATTVNKDALKYAIAEGDKKSESDYTAESWAPFAEALAKAKEVMDNEAATQEEVDAAEKTLREAMDALEEKTVVNKDALEKAITEGDKKTEDDYTAESWAPFAEALDKAKEVMDNEAATQEEVDAAEKALREAMDALEEKPVVNKDALKKAIEEGDKKSEDDYTAETWKKFADALDNAKKVRDNPNATQEEVDAAEKALREAMDALEEKPVVNKDALKKAIEEGEKKTEEDYTAETWKKFEDALDNAKKVRDNPNASQEEVDVAEKALKEAMTALKKAPTEEEPPEESVNKDALKKAIEEGEKKTEVDYTPETWKKFADALDNAKKVRDNSNATQAQIDEALDMLVKASAALQTKVIDTGDRTSSSIWVLLMLLSGTLICAVTVRKKNEI